jgi:hypothetical protein
MLKALVVFALLALASGAFMVGSADSNAAIVIHKDTGFCGMPGSDAGGNITFGGIGNIQLEVQNSNKVQITCKGTGITNLSGSGQHYKGFGCGIIDANGNLLLATNSDSTVSASGEGTLTCSAPE